MISVIPFVCEELTFFTLKLRRIVSLIWLSHIEHIIPSVFNVVFIIIMSFRFILSTNRRNARKKRAFVQNMKWDGKTQN